MNIVNLFSQTSVASTLIFLSLAGISGIVLGKIAIFKIKLGIAGVLFAGLLLGHLGAHPDAGTLQFVKEFGLILFVYSIGLEVGPRFLPSLRNNGLKMNLLATGIVVLGVLTAAAIKVIYDLPTPVIAGILCGAVTNTPSLGAAQQVITEQIANQPDLIHATATGYAVAYPIGIIGIILTMLLLRFIFKISVKSESEKYHSEVAGVRGKLSAINMKVINPTLIGKNITFMKASLEGEFVLSRMWRDGEFFMPTDEEVIRENDMLYGVSSESHFSSLELKVGPLKDTGELEVTDKLGMRHVVFTNKSMAGKTIKQIGLSRSFPVNVTRIFRAGMEIMPGEEDTIEFGDTVRIVGERSALNKVAALLGNSMTELAHPNIIPILIGILAGVLIGSIPLSIPGLPAPAKLGLAGGPLLVALFLGYKGRIGKLDFFMTPGANLFIRELGIVLFLACVGLSSGGTFVETIVNGGYVWMAYGAVITLLPILIIGIIASLMKMNYLTICGLLAGSMTDPPALEFANSISPGQAQSTAYATVYPLVMFLRVLVAQILVLLFL
ncbi:MAG: putative transporter [Bacteroidales bacterium]|nr:putative transporter [Bacteroidales bacterium]